MSWWPRDVCPITVCSLAHNGATHVLCVWFKVGTVQHRHTNRTGDHFLISMFFSHCYLLLIQEVLKETLTQECYIWSLSMHPLRMEGGMEFQSPQHFWSLKTSSNMMWKQKKEGLRTAHLVNSGSPEAVWSQIDVKRLINGQDLISKNFSYD